MLQCECEEAYLPLSIPSDMVHQAKTVKPLTCTWLALVVPFYKKMLFAKLISEASDRCAQVTMCFGCMFISP